MNNSTEAHRNRIQFSVQGRIFFKLRSKRAGHTHAGNSADEDTFKYKTDVTLRPCTDRQTLDVDVTNSS
jgi:hypothetical protein